MARPPSERGVLLNAAFLDTKRATSMFVQPVLEGLGMKVGALVFRLSPLPASRLARIPVLLNRLDSMLGRFSLLPVFRNGGSNVVVAVEVRNPELVTPEIANIVKNIGTTYNLGLHAHMQPIGAQLPLLRASWPRPLVCRWNLRRNRAAHGYEAAKQLYALSMH